MKQLEKSSSSDAEVLVFGTLEGSPSLTVLAVNLKKDNEASLVPLKSPPGHVGIGATGVRFDSDIIVCGGVKDDGKVSSR